MFKKLNSIVLASLLIIMGLLSISCVISAQDFRVDGNVFDSDTRNPIDGAYIRVETTDDNFVCDANTDSSGYYELWLDEGNYNIFVSASDYQDQEYFDVHIDGDHMEDVYLISEGSGGGDSNGDSSGGDFRSDGDSSDGDGEEGEDVELPEEFKDLGEQAQMLATVCMAFFFLLIICLILITVFSIANFVRLGKIKKGLDKSSAKQKRQQPQAPPQPQYQSQLNAQQQNPPQQPQGSSAQSHSPAPQSPNVCTSCGNQLQVGWQFCPFCQKNV